MGSASSGSGLIWWEQPWARRRGEGWRLASASKTVPGLEHVKVNSRTQPRCGGNEADLALLLLCRQGDRKALEKLCELHYGLIAYWARKLAERFSSWAHFDPEDLTQAGMMGLVQAAKNFDAGQQGNFHWYASLCFMRAVYACPELQLVKRNHRENRKKVTEAHDVLAVELNRKPTVEEISQSSGLTIKQVQNVLNTASPFHRDLEELEEWESPATATPQSALAPAWSQDLEDAIRRLESSDARVIVHYYYWGMTDQEVGSQLGQSKDAAKAKRYRALEKLKRIILDEGDTYDGASGN